MFLVEKNAHLKYLKKENILLEHVSADYEKYYEFILSEKQAQLEAMRKIKQSLEDLIISGKLYSIPWLKPFNWRKVRKQKIVLIFLEP